MYEHWADRLRSYMNFRTGNWHVGHGGDDRGVVCVMANHQSRCPNVLQIHNSKLFKEKVEWTIKFDGPDGERTWDPLTQYVSNGKIIATKK